MKVSVSLPDEDVDFLDSYADSQGFASRSATKRYDCISPYRRSGSVAAASDAPATGGARPTEVLEL